MAIMPDYTFSMEQQVDVSSYVVTGTNWRKFSWRQSKVELCHSFVEIKNSMMRFLRPEERLNFIHQFILSSKLLKQVPKTLWTSAWLCMPKWKLKLTQSLRARNSQFNDINDFIKFLSIALILLVARSNKVILLLLIKSRESIVSRRLPARKRLESRRKGLKTFSGRLWILLFKRLRLWTFVSPMKASSWISETSQFWTVKKAMFVARVKARAGIKVSCGLRCTRKWFKFRPLFTEFPLRDWSPPDCTW